MNETIKKQVIEHGENIKRIFGLNKDMDPVALCRKLRRLEIKAHKLATDYCNGENNINTDNIDFFSDPILAELDSILKFTEKKIPVMIEYDARGYALKIMNNYISNNKIQMHRDWGGYGIIAPEFK